MCVLHTSFSQRVSGPDKSLLTLVGAFVALAVEAPAVLRRSDPQVARYTMVGAKVHLTPLSVLNDVWPLGASDGELLLGAGRRVHPRKDIATSFAAGVLIARRRPDVPLPVIGVAEASRHRTRLGTTRSRRVSPSGSA